MPLHEVFDPIRKIYLRRIAKDSLRTGNICIGKRYISGLQWQPSNDGFLPESVLDCPNNSVQIHRVGVTEIKDAKLAIQGEGGCYTIHDVTDIGIIPARGPITENGDRLATIDHFREFSNGEIRSLPR